MQSFYNHLLAAFGKDDALKQDILFFILQSLLYEDNFFFQQYKSLHTGGNSYVKRDFLNQNG